MTRHLLRAFLLVALACRSERASPPPTAEFLVAAGDSTFWIRSGREGIAMRASPIFLARFGGRFYEIYATDDDRSYYDAVMIGLRVYRRDLLTGDSMVVYEDRTIPEVARRYAASHPDQIPLDPAEEAAEEPRTVATAEVEFLDLHGPYLSFEEHTDIDSDEAEHVHAVRRGVLDLRSGGRVGVRAMFGDSAAGAVIDGGRAAFGASLDSVLAARGAIARRAARAIADFRFDPSSFSVTARGRTPLVEFLVPSERDRSGGLALTLPPLEVSRPPWWGEIEETLPAVGGADADQWRRPAYAVIAQYAPAGDTVSLALADTTRRWTAGALPAPIYRIFWLDAPAIDSTSRRALARAFDEASLYSEDARVAWSSAGLRAGVAPVAIRPEMVALASRHRPARWRAPVH